MPNPKLTYRMSVRIFAEDEKCFGPGLLDLLERVGVTHSLNRSSKDMNMAYSKAWRIIKTAEAALGYRLLDTAVGGKSGGGATLTPEAQSLIASYKAFMEALNKDAQKRFAEYFEG